MTEEFESHITAVDGGRFLSGVVTVPRPGTYPHIVSLLLA